MTSADETTGGVNPFLEASRTRDAKSLEQFWLQARNFALYSDDALKLAIADPRRQDQVSLTLPLPTNGDSVVDTNFRPELDQVWADLRLLVQRRRLGLTLSISDSRDNWRERTLYLSWSSFALALQNDKGM